jgi:hypothetical protein
MTGDERRFRPVKQPHTSLSHGPNGMWYVVCWHCDWQAGPSVKTYVAERALQHRNDHRAGRAAPAEPKRPL